MDLLESGLQIVGQILQKVGQEPSIPSPPPPPPIILPSSRRPWVERKCPLYTW